VLGAVAHPLCEGRRFTLGDLIRLSLSDRACLERRSELSLLSREHGGRELGQGDSPLVSAI
jgi:hypothetical protein